MVKQRFAILDRDGTIIEERHYLAEAEQVELLPGAAMGLRLLKDMGIGLVVATNQSGVGRGFFNTMQLERIHQRLGELLQAEGIILDGIYFCPHMPSDDCQCRKPRLGLLEKAAKELGFAPSSCFVIGDNESDILFGNRAGATTLLVRTGYGAQVEAEGTHADYVVEGLPEAAVTIQRLIALGERRDAVAPKR